MLYFYAIIAENPFLTGKQNPPNWKNIFSQLGNYFFAVKWSCFLNIYAKAFQLSFSCFSCSNFR